MNASKKAIKILEQIRTITKMERGKICKMAGRNHYNHQTWQNGKNTVRYVPVNELKELQKAIEGYTLFTNLMNKYADEIIRITRKERIKNKK